MKKIDREKVYHKYNGRCAYCGKLIDYKQMQVDHIIPQRNGGTDIFDNLNPSCRRCNHYKRALSLEEYRDQVATILSRLEKIYIYNVAIDYGIVTSHPPINFEFYFERFERWAHGQSYLDKDVLREIWNNFEDEDK